MFHLQGSGNAEGLPATSLCLCYLTQPEIQTHLLSVAACQSLVPCDPPALSNVTHTHTHCFGLWEWGAEREFKRSAGGTRLVQTSPHRSLSRTGTICHQREHLQTQGALVNQCYSSMFGVSISGTTVQHQNQTFNLSAGIQLDWTCAHWVNSPQGKSIWLA